MGVVQQGGCLEESRLRLCFDRDWRVVAFDKTAWFRHLTGMGFKGVDFIGLRDEWVYLIEVKNFKSYKSGKGTDSPSSASLQKALAEKFSDSERLTGVILGTLERHLLFRLWRRTIMWWPWLRTLEPEWAFWLDVNQRIGAGQLRLTVLLQAAPPVMDRDWPADWIVIIDEGPWQAPPGLHVEAIQG